MEREPRAIDLIGSGGTDVTVTQVEPPPEPELPQTGTDPLAWAGTAFAIAALLALSALARRRR